MPFCDHCEGWYFDHDTKLYGPHKCPPKWECFREGDYPDDAVTEVYATEAVEAAEKFAAWSDSQGDYDIAGGSEEEVTVVRTDTQEVFRLVVSGSMQPCYDAQVIE